MKKIKFNQKDVKDITKNKKVIRELTEVFDGNKDAVENFITLLKTYKHSYNLKFLVKMKLKTL